jgi:hypothetical protein
MSIDIHVTCDTTNFDEKVTDKSIGIQLVSVAVISS